eukprot:2062050-Prymnesium_polylepis.1
MPLPTWKIPAEGARHGRHGARAALSNTPAGSAPRCATRDTAKGAKDTAKRRESRSVQEHALSKA